MVSPYILLNDDNNNAHDDIHNHNNSYNTDSTIDTTTFGKRYLLNRIM